MAPTKPKLRGVLHEIAFYVSLITGPVLVLIARGGSHIAAAIYSLAMTALFGFSALYHRPTWRPTIRRWLGRVDHSMSSSSPRPRSHRSPSRSGPPGRARFW